METCPSFSQFLQEAAVLSQRQAEKLTLALANNDEDQSIFKLADFFRTLTPSDCYDLALRLHLLWKKAATQPPVIEKKESVNIPETPSDLHQKKKTFKNLKSVSHFPEKNDTFASESETKSTTNFASPTRGNLFDYLHSESNRKNYTKLENEQRKMENEMKGCSFQPNTSKYQSVRNSTEVFDRLQQDLRREKTEMNESKKLEIEMRDCTFTPALVSKRLATEDVSMYSSRSSLNQTFDRLYKDHQVKKHHSIENELKKQELEVKGCTFQPALSSRNRSPSHGPGQGGDYTDRFNQLYKLHSERQRSLMKKRIEKSEEEEKKFAFKPAIKASPAKRTNSKGVQERLLEWNEKKNQKLEIKMQEKMIAEKSMNRELNLPARRESDITSPQGGQAFERLYQDSEMKKVRKEILEKRVLKDVGASFTPKTNLSRNTSARKQKENISTGFFGGADPNLNVSRDEERFSRQRSPAQKKFEKQAEEQKAWNNVLYRKHFLDDIQNNLVMDPDGKTATFGHY